MSMLDRNEPKMTGQPGRMSWARAIPDSASASCCVSAAGMVTGDIAPISRNGVSTTGWPAAQYSNWASSIRSSQRSGELQLISETVAGVRADAGHGLADQLQLAADQRDRGRRPLDRRSAFPSGPAEQDLGHLDG